MALEEAERISCADAELNRRLNCVMDVTVTAERKFAETYLIS